MRIDLAGDHKSKRKKGRRKRGRRPFRTFDSAIALPEARPRRRTGRDPNRVQRSPADRGREEARSAALSRLKRGSRTERSASRVRRWHLVSLKILALVVVLGLGAVTAYASVDTKFFVYEGRIVGARHSDAVEIYKTAGVHEQSIFWLDPQQVAERVIQLDGIKAVRVRLELPSSVTIEVEEREPAVMWRATRQQKDWWLDREGVVLPYHGDVNSPEMVFVVDKAERDLKEGDHIQPAGIVQSVLQLAAAVPGIRVFYHEPDRGLSFTQQVAGGEWPVYVGTSRDLPRKIQVMQALTSYLQGNNIRPNYVDVRWADHPVYGKTPSEEPAGGQ